MGVFGRRTACVFFGDGVVGMAHIGGTASLFVACFGVETTFEARFTRGGVDGACGRGDEAVIARLNAL